MKEQSLHQIMNEMVQRLDTIRPADQSKRAPEALSELEAFMHMDGLLASLNKEYLDAKSQRKELVKLYGADDAMSEVAIDMEDSAWCAMQTRYMELRQNREIMNQAQQLMRRSERDAEEFLEMEKKREQERQLKQFVYFSQLLDRVKEMNKTPAIFEWIIVFMMFKMEPFNQKQKFSLQASAV